MDETKDKKPGDDLTESQKAFVREWIEDFNGTRAYMAAYPESSKESARSSAADLLAKPNVRAYATLLQENLAEIAGISRLRIVKEHEKLAFSSIAHLHNTWIERKEFDQLSDAEKACIAEISTQTRRVYEKNEKGDKVPVDIDFVKIKLYDKQKSLDSLSKLFGYDAAKKVDITTLGKPIESAPPINVYTNGAPPLSGSEDEIEKSIEKK